MTPTFSFGDDPASSHASFPFDRATAANGLPHSPPLAGASSVGSFSTFDELIKMNATTAQNERHHGRPLTAHASQNMDADLRTMLADEEDVHIKKEPVESDFGSSLALWGLVWVAGADLVVSPTSGPAFDVPETQSQSSIDMSEYVNDDHSVVASPDRDTGFPAPSTSALLSAWGDAYPFDPTYSFDFPSFPTASQQFASFNPKQDEMQSRAMAPEVFESPMDSPYSSPLFQDQNDTSPAWGSEEPDTPDLAVGSLSLFPGCDSAGGSSAFLPFLPAFLPPLPSSQTTVVPDAEYHHVVEAQVEVEIEEVRVKIEEADSTVVSDPVEEHEDEPSSDEYKPPVAKPFSRKRKSVGSSASSESAPSPASPRSTKTSKRWNGTRDTKLLDADAPIQSRKYSGPSATARKVLPKAIAKTAKARGVAPAASTSASPEREDDIPPALQEFVADRRTANTLAARKSRALKAQHLKDLEEGSAMKDELIAHLRNKVEELEEENGRMKKKLRLSGADE